MRKDDSITSDGWTSLEAGINSGMAPNILPANQAAFAINVTFRGAFPSTRPGFPKHTLVFSDGDTKTNFETKRFQGAHHYDGGVSGQFMVAAIGGRQFRINPANWSVLEITPPGPRNSELDYQNWMYQAEEFLIIQNGRNRPIIYNGGVAVRAAPYPAGIPVGTVGTYVNGRIWQATRQNSFVAGDIVYGPGGSGTSAILNFDENLYLNLSGAFNTPATSGPITAMATIAVPDTSLGQGPLLVITPNAIYTVNAPTDRTTWKNLNTPIQTIALIGHGGQNQNSTTLVNGDVYFRAVDGVRSFLIARRDFTMPGNTPMSREMARIIDADDPTLLRYASAQFFDNRLLMTCSPARHDRGIYHRGLMALNFDLVSSMRQKLQPAWDGLWTGLRVLQLVRGQFNGIDRCFAFVLGDTDKIEVWEISKDARVDNTSNRIQCVLETKSYGFEDQGEWLKQLETADIWVDDVEGQVDFATRFRPNQYPCWIDWHSWAECNNIETCNPEECTVPKNYRPGYRPRMRMPQPADDCSAEIGEPWRQGYEFSARLEWTGKARIKRFILRASRRVEESVGGCPT